MRELEHGVVSQVHRAAHSSHHVLGINRVLAVHDPNPLVHLSRANLCLKRELETASALPAFQRLEPPTGIGGFPMNGMPLSAKRRSVAAKRQAEEIAA